VSIIQIKEVLLKKDFIFTGVLNKLFKLSSHRKQQFEVRMDDVEENVSLDSEDKQNVANTISNLDLFVCGKCLFVSHFVEPFVKHKDSECSTDDVKDSIFDELNNTKLEEKRPQIWAFALWKNKVLEENDKKSSWDIYQEWLKLESNVKQMWVKAGERLSDINDIAGKTTKISVKKRRDTVESEVDRYDSEEDSKTNVVNESKVYTMKAPRSDSKVHMVVEKIVSKRYHPRNKRFEYLIKWEGMDSSSNTWEPVSVLGDCKPLLDDFEKTLAIKKAQIKQQKNMEKKVMKAKILEVASRGRPPRSSKQKALNTMKVWVDKMEAEGEGAGKRVFSDDSEDDENFEKRLKLENYNSSDSDEGVELRTRETRSSLPNNILIPDSNGVIKLTQKQLPALRNGVFVMSKTAGIIKLESRAVDLATSVGKTILHVAAPGINGVTHVKVIKNGATKKNNKKKM